MTEYFRNLAELERHYRALRTKGGSVELRRRDSQIVIWNHRTGRWDAFQEARPGYAKVGSYRHIGQELVAETGDRGP